MIKFQILDQRYTEEALGLIPYFIFEEDPRPAAAQLSDRYAHGGGWTPLSGWSMGPVGEIKWEREEALPPIAVATLHDNEIIRFYRHAWVSITQLDGSFQVARID